MKRILMMACAVVALASCSKEANDPTTQGDATQIRASSSIEGVATKAITETSAALTGITFLRYDNEAVNKTTDFDFSASVDISGSRATDGEITFDPSQQYDVVDKTSYILGYHPAGTLSDKVATWTPDGATDILMTNVWNAGRYSSPKTTGMTFRHILARIEVVCQAEGGAALSVVQNMWGNITSIKFVNALPNMTYTYATNTVAAAGTAADFTLLNGASYTTGAFTSVAMPENGSTAVTASAMLPPTASAAITLKVKTADQGEITKNITLTGNFEKGKIHKVTLTFKADGKNIDATSSTIEDWGTGYTGSGDIEI